jgi:hypothetical protein
MIAIIHVDREPVQGGISRQSGLLGAGVDYSITIIILQDPRDLQKARSSVRNLEFSDRPWTSRLVTTTAVHGPPDVAVVCDLSYDVTGSATLSVGSRDNAIDGGDGD